MFRRLDQDSRCRKGFAEHCLRKYRRGGHGEGGGRRLCAQRCAAGYGDGDSAVRVGHEVGNIEVGFGGGWASSHAADKLDVRGLRYGGESWSIAGFSGRGEREG